MVSSLQSSRILPSNHTHLAYHGGFSEYTSHALCERVSHNLDLLLKGQDICKEFSTYKKRDANLTDVILLKKK